jgi:ssDNA-binding Zn-finger/Zn-ribbon topoisomerase 1
MSTRICEKCNAEMVLMEIEDGGNIQICSRKGCKKHLLEFEDLQTELKAFYNVYSTFFKG